jgi:hypothetical protein
MLENLEKFRIENASQILGGDNDRSCDGDDGMGG